VLKDKTVFALFILGALSAAVFYILASQPEVAAGLPPSSRLWIFELWSIPIAGGILAAALVFRRYLQADLLFRSPTPHRSSTRTLSSSPSTGSPKSRKFSVGIDWKRLVRDEIVFVLILFATLSAAAFHFLSRHPAIAAGVVATFWAIVTVGILAAAVALLRRLLVIFRGSRLAKIDWKPVVSENVLALLFVATLSAGVFYMHPDITTGFVTLSPVAIGGGIILAGALIFAAPTLVAHPGRILGASAFLAAVLAFLVAQPAVYAGTAAFEPVWRAALMQFAGYTTLGALFVSAMLLLAAWHASGAVTTTGRGKPPESPPDRLLRVLAALVAAYLIVYFLFTGYVFTGYFARYLSLTIFLNDLVLALGLTAMIDCARGCYDRFRESIGWRRIVLGSATPIAAFGLAGVVVYWGSLQTFLVRKLPPDEISFFPILSTPPFRGSTFAASIYGGTLSYFNKNWAYYDANSALAEGGVTLGPDGYEVKRDDAYVWFADRSVNAAYNKPEYFLAMTFQFWATYGKGAAYLMDGEAVQRPRAGDIPLVRAIREGRTSYLQPVEVARVISPR
jgi:hypothetical protein